MRITATLVGLLLLVLASSAIAASGDCMSTFYKTKDMGCVDSTLEAVRPRGGVRPGQETATKQPLVGFLAEVFSTFPKEKQRLLDKKLSPLAQLLCAEALWRAGLYNEALRYAQANGLEEAYRRYNAQVLAPVRQMKPFAWPGDNDLLIGAYMASGNAQFIRNILANYTAAEDGMVSDAFRMSLVGFRSISDRSVPEERKKNLTKALCKKYECERDKKDFMRVMTLASAYWALGSLGQDDIDIQSMTRETFERDARLKRLLAIEQSAFSNYMTLLMLQTTVKDMPSVEPYLAGYENLGTPKELEAALLKSPLFQKKAN